MNIRVARIRHNSDVKTLASVADSIIHASLMLMQRFFSLHIFMSVNKLCLNHMPVTFCSFARGHENCLVRYTKGKSCNTELLTSNQTQNPKQKVDTFVSSVGNPNI